MTEITVADLRRILIVALHLAVVGWLASAAAGLDRLAAVLVGVLAFTAVGLVAIHLQRFEAW